MGNKNSASAESYFKVLAFGASLTEGFYNGGYSFHPYSNKLESNIDDRFKEVGIPKQCIIHQHGKSGEFTDHMIPRLHGILSKAADYPYKLVCILAGTNDLSRDHEKSSDVTMRLRQLYDMVLNHHEKTFLVAITIPQSQCVAENYVNKRSAINEDIRNFCQTTERAICVDFEKIIPYFEDSSQLKRNRVLWDDPLHMTPVGYDSLADLIYQHIVIVLDGEVDALS